jgi:hypothetical protein
MLARCRSLFTICSVVLTAGLAVACKSPMSAEVDEYANLVNQGRMLTCVCYSDLDFDTMISCQAAQGEISEDDQQCMLDAFDGEEDLGKDYLDCASPILEQYVQCMNQDPGCEMGWADDCRATRDATLGTCLQLPADILGPFNACHL